MLLCFYVNLRCCTTSFMDSPWRHGFTAAWKSGGAAGATHVQISWISAWIPSEVTRTFFFDLPIWDSNSSPFSCRSFSSQREPTVVGSITSKGEPIFAHVNMHGFRWKFMAPSSSRAQNSVMKIAERSSLKILPSPNTTHYHSRQSSRCGCFSPRWNPTQPMHVSFNSDLKYVSQNKLTRR